MTAPKYFTRASVTYSVITAPLTVRCATDKNRFHFMPLYCIFQSSVRLKYKHKILILSQVFTIFAFKPTKLDIISNQTNLPKFEYHFSEQDPRYFHIFFSRCAESIRQSKRAVVHESIFIPHLNKMCNLTLECNVSCLI